MFPLIRKGEVLPVWKEVMVKPRKGASARVLVELYMGPDDVRHEENLQVGVCMSLHILGLWDQIQSSPLIFGFEIASKYR